MRYRYSDDTEKVLMAEKTRGQQFFDEHNSYLWAGDIEGLVKNGYTSDAILISSFDILEVPPPHVVHAGPDLVKFFARWLDYHGAVTVDSLYDFAELDDSISFQALMTTQTGKWVVGEAWHLAGDKIDRHYG